MASRPAFLTSRLAGLAGLALTVSAHAADAPAANAPTTDKRMPETLAAAVASSVRTPALVARDGFRHPVEELGFFGIKPHAHVVEIWPGRGYWTEILAPYLHDHGTYDLAVGPSRGTPPPTLAERLPPPLQARIKSDPAAFGHIRFTELAPGHLEIAPPGTADLVLTFRNLHNWLEDGDVPEMLAAIHTALKPGGILGIEDHRARADRAQDPKAADGYVRQDYAIRLIEKAGFKLVGSSEMNANPKDTTHWPKGVWTLPPTFALGAQDHDRYAAIGEGDNFVLKFRKVP